MTADHPYIAVVLAKIKPIMMASQDICVMNSGYRRLRLQNLGGCTRNSCVVPEFRGEPLVASASCHDCERS